MKLNDYQAAANETSGSAGQHSIERLTIAALGCAGEAGELADLVKKLIGHGHYLDTPKLAEEMGDLLWYVAEAASALGLSLADIARDNLTKLDDRYPHGFDPEISRSRYG